MQMKKAVFVYVLIFMMLVTMLVPARTTHAVATTLQRGDIAVVGINVDDPYPTQRWAFVILKDIGSDTVIHFTDNSIISSSGYVFTSKPTEEGHMTWTVPSDLTAGKVFLVTNNSNGNATITDSANTTYSGVAGSLGGTSSGFSANGDQIFVYQGTKGTTVGATFIYAFANGQGVDFINNGWWTTGSASVDRNSFAPSGLTSITANSLNSNTSGTNSGIYGNNNLRYNGPKTGTKTDILTAIATPANWVGSNFTPYTNLISMGNFTVTPSSEPSVSYYTVTYNGNGSTGGWAPADRILHPEGETVNVLTNAGTLVRTEYTFGGWNTLANGTGTDYAANSTLTMPASNLTLYAKWIPVPPAAPVVTGVTNAAKYSATVSPTWTDVTGTTSTATLSKDGGAAQSYTKGTAITNSGSYELKVTSTKTANNSTATTTLSFTLDTVAPLAPVVTGVTSGTTYATSVSPTWTDETGTTSTATLSKDGAVAQSFTKGTTISDGGTYELKVTSTKTSNNLTTTTTVPFTIVTNGPVAPVVTGVVGGATYNSSVTPTWIDDTGTTSTATLSKDGGTAQSYTNGTSISDHGVYELKVTSTVTANNLSATRTVTFTIDKTAPTAPVVTGAENGKTYASSVTPTWTDASGTTSTATLSKDGATVQSYTKGTAISDNGSYELKVTSNKTLNNLSTTTTLTFTIDSNAGILQSGDIAVVGINTSDAYPAQKWAFVILRDIVTGTTIHFTDASITESFVFQNNATIDGHMTWTVPQALTAGQVFLVTNNPSGNATIKDATNTTTYTGVNGSVGGTSSGFSSNGDQIIVYQGIKGTTTGATFIYAINNSQGGEYLANGNWLLTGGQKSVDRLSYLPSGLTTKTGISFATTSFSDTLTIYGKSNLNYNGPKTGTKADILNAIATPGNWVGTFKGSSTYDFSTMGNFTVAPSTAPATTYYTVTYSSNGSTGGTFPYDRYLRAQGDSVKVLDNIGVLAKTGFSFIGWNTAADGTGTNYPVSSTFTMPASNLTLYAQWVNYSVTYIDNGATSGNVPVDNSKYTSGATVTILDNTGNLEKPGFAFVGWNTLANGKGTSYAALGTFNITSNVVLYAKWSNGAPDDPVVTGVEDGTTYPLVAPTWTDISDSTMSATLSKNGGPALSFSRGTVISESGSYVLKVTRTKTSNNMSATTTVAFNVGESSTILLPGDIAIVGVNTSDVYPSQRWAFTPLRNIPAGTVVHFTDASITETYSFLNAATEGHMTWTVPSNITAGQLFIVTNNQGGNATIKDVADVTYGGVDGSLGAFLANADQIFVYQGTKGTTAGAKFIYAVNNSQGPEYGSFGSWMKSGNISGNDRLSYAPQGLTAKTTVVLTSIIFSDTGNILGKSNLKFNGPKAGTKSELLTALSTSSNWVGTFRGQTTYDFKTMGNFTLRPSTLNFYTVSYDGNGNTDGVVPTDNNIYQTGDTASVLGNTNNLSKTGSVFVGWNREPDGSGFNYRNNSRFTVLDSSVVLYAKWTMDPTYKVTYNANGSTSGSVPTDSNNYLPGENAVILGNVGNLAKTEYTLKGWNTAADGTGLDYDSTKLLNIAQSNITLYAKWELSPKYTVTYSGNGNTGGTVPIDTNTYLQGTGATVLPNSGNLVRTGHTFEGWNITANEFSTNYQPNGKYTIPNSNATLYAKWKPIDTYRIVMESNFESDVRVVYDEAKRNADIVGTDTTVTSGNNNSFDALNGDLDFYLYYRPNVEAKNLTNYEIVKDPLDPNNNVLKLQVLDYGKDEGTNSFNGRAQGQFMMGPLAGRKEIYNVLDNQYRQYISPDYQELNKISEYKPKASDFKDPNNTTNLLKWFGMYEIWFPRTMTDQQDVMSQLGTTNGAGSFRIGFAFGQNYDNPNENGGFVWHLTAEDMEFRPNEGYNQWEVKNTSIPVPFGKWVEWDIHIVKGPDPKIDPSSPAHVVVKMRLVGETEWQTLFDVRNERTQHTWIPTQGIYQAGIFKNYLGPSTVHYLKNIKGKNDISLYFDNFKYAVDTKTPPPPVRNINPNVGIITLDNADVGPSVTKIGNWLVPAEKNLSKLRNGVDYLSDFGAAEDDFSVKFQPDLPSDGLYNVTLYSVTNETYSSAKVPVEIVHANGSKQMYISQKYEQHVSLGQYYFNKGTAGSVTIRNYGVVDGSVSVDAIRFELVSPIIPSSVTVPAAVTVTESETIPLTGITFADTGTGANNVTATLNVSSGSLNAVSGAGVTVNGIGAKTLTLTGSKANINAFIAANNVSYTAASNTVVDVGLKVSINDGGNNSNTPDTGAATILVAPTAPEVIGVANMKKYDSAVAALWSEKVGGIYSATISKDGALPKPYTKGLAISQGGAYELKVRSISSGGLEATTTINFKINDTVETPPTPPTPTTPSNKVDLDAGAAKVEIGKDEKGNNMMKFNVTDQKKFADSIFALKEKQDKNPTSQSPSISVDVKKSEPNVPLLLDIPANIIKDATNQLPNVVLDIKFDNITYQLPLQMLDSNAIANSLGTSGKNLKFAIKIEPLTGKDKEDITNNAKKSQYNLLTDAIDFQIVAEEDGKKTEVKDFGTTYVNRSVTINQTISGNKASGVTFNPANGEFSFVPSTFTTENNNTTVTFKRNGNSIYTVIETTPKTFADLVTSDQKPHWAKADIELLASKLIVNGVTSTTFAPNDNITRAQFATLLVRALGLTVQTGPSIFKDIATSDWYAAHVNTAVSAKLVEGFEDKTFRPNDLITREQMAVMLTRAIAATGQSISVGNKTTDQILAPFKDNQNVSSWSKDAMAKLVVSELLQGTSETTISPNEKATRAQATVVLKRFLQYVKFID